MKTDQLKQLCGVLLDADGVLWKEAQPLADLAGMFERLMQLELEVVVVTNNSTRTPAYYLERFREMGVPLEEGQVINSSLATAEYLKRQHPGGGPVFLVGETGLYQTLEEHGFNHLDPSPGNEKGLLAVVAGMDRELTYRKVDRAAALIRKGVPFIGTNPDKTYPTPDGLSPGAGTVLAAIEAASGQQPQIMGKPRKGLFQSAFRKLGCDPGAVLMVGDRLETDILGAHRAGCLTALVLSGVSTAEDAENFDPSPDWIFPDITSVVEFLEDQLEGQP
jgi:4-nitrophenyl phosphatase